MRVAKLESVSCQKPPCPSFGQNMREPFNLAHRVLDAYIGAIDKVPSVNKTIDSIANVISVASETKTYHVVHNALEWYLKAVSKVKFLDRSTDFLTNLFEKVMYKSK